jgi:hypothetical protein
MQSLSHDQHSCRRWSRSPERKRSKVWRRAVSPDSSSSSDSGGRRFLEQEDRRRAGRTGRFGTGAAADARINHVRPPTLNLCEENALSSSSFVQTL